MDYIEKIIKKRSAPGILLFDMADRMVFASKEALDIFAGRFKTKIRKHNKASFIPKKIFNLYNKCKSSINTSGAGVIENDCVIFHGDKGLSYSARAFPVELSGKEKKIPYIMIFVEKIGEKRSVDFEKARRRYNLTKRELELVKLVCEGLTNKDISQKLFISEHTVKDHIKNIMRKMNASSRNEIVAIMVR